MAKRMTKAEASLLGIALVVGAPIFAVIALVKSIGWVVPALVVVVVVALIAWSIHDKKQKRLAYLREKYNNEDIVQKIFNGYFWQGQTAEQLQDSLGSPVDIDQKLLKTKTRNIWKYRHQGANRFGLRITVENGYVTGWDQKS